MYIAGAGIISPLGKGLAATVEALQANSSAIRPLDLFPLLHGEPLPVGQVRGLDESSSLPRTHRLARIAAIQAMAGGSQPPDAVILGTTTGGILTTEQLLRDNVGDKELYRYHGLNSVAEYIARETGCRGPALAVSTACSSGAVAIAMALEMLRSGKAKTVLAGGVDSLCRLTYFGFHSLQLVDKKGCRPFDADRHGMAVAEGAAMLLLTTERPDTPLAELLGAGLSCDAYHPAAPHPEGRGALMAMWAALTDAGLEPEDIDYINLHGTGTPENDLVESKAIKTLFVTPPPLSSIKGAMGHSLAASGAIEAVVSAIAVFQNFLPANTGWEKLDPALGLTPLTQPISQPVTAVLSNSFGFGGNNGCLVITQADSVPASPAPRGPRAGLAVHGRSCVSGSGNTAATMSQLVQGLPVAGMVDLDSLSENLPPRLVRRLKRLPRMTLSLAAAALADSGLEEKPSAVFMGTGWGALSETYDFLTRLAESQEQFPSPTDFVGSVHNGPAGQAAIMFEATGANITTSGGDYSFEQALLAADLMMKEGDERSLVLGVDEGHQALSPLLDPSIAPATLLADGGGGLCLSRTSNGAQCLVRVPFYQSSATEGAIDLLIETLGGVQILKSKYALVLAGIPAAVREEGEAQLARFVDQSGCQAPVIRYRELTGEFASASAVAAVMAVSFLTERQLPAGEEDGKNAILVLGLGPYLSAMEFSRP
ncbi:MAG: beta-ketoacyl synthase N-terminal-like domain-containing protein [Desulfocapsaceae bacterium]|nr:beta-ketoacyl synthase N-terminal-like domain-containing protein [Desulfocapsaceae bacterium]